MAVLAVIVVLVLVQSGGGSKHAANTGGDATSVSLITKYRPGYSNTSCLQMPDSAQVRFFAYLHNTGNKSASFNKDIHAIWLDLNGKTVDAFQNTMLSPSPKVSPNLYKVAYADFPASGEQPIIKCWITVGDSPTRIPIHVNH